MLKKYSQELPVKSKVSKDGPSMKALQLILNYSKSIDVARLKQEKMLIHLN